MRVCGQHANLLQEVFKSGRFLGHVGEDQSLLGHGLGIMSRIKLLILLPALRTPGGYRSPHLM